MPKWTVDIEMNQQGEITNISKVSGGDGGTPPKGPTKPHSDVVVMVAQKHSPGHICFWFGGNWICF